MDRRDFIASSVAFLGGLKEVWSAPTPKFVVDDKSHSSFVVDNKIICLPVGANEPTHPRNPRVLMFHADWCKPCRDSLANFKEWLEASGWEVSERDRAHVQLIDVDKDAGAMLRWNVKSLPTFILLEDGREKRRHVGLATGQTILGLFGMSPTKTTAVAPPKPVMKTGQRMAGYHTHTCRRDGTRWGHPLFGYSVSHNCPNCGRTQYDQD